MSTITTTSTSIITAPETHLHPIIYHYHLKSHKKTHDCPNDYHVQTFKQLLWTPEKNCLD
jgi:hypothetical protein